MRGTNLRLHPRSEPCSWVLRAPAQGSLSVHPQAIQGYRFRFALPGRYFRALALACRRSPSFRPTRRSHQGPAGFRLSSLWLTIGFASLPVLSSASVLRCRNTRILLSKSTNLQAVRFITKSLGYWSLSVAPPTCVSPGLIYRPWWPRTL